MLKFGSKHGSNIVYKCTVRLLKDSEIIENEFKAYHKGNYLRDYVCHKLNLVEWDYLGLRYVDVQNQRQWLDLEKSIYKQVKDLDPVVFSFRVKFYPPDPFRLREETTRYQIFLQLKRDLLHGRLYCDTNEAAMFAALILQAEVGDYDPEIHSGNYVSNFNILLKQTEAIENKAMEIHQEQLKCQSKRQVENTFFKLACHLDTYGVDPHPVKPLYENHKGAELYLGINYRGILAFRGSRKTHHFRWPDIQKLRYEGNIFLIYLYYNHKRHIVGFKCPSETACRYTWRCGIEQMLFFTSVVTGKGLFSWGTKFKYNGRTEHTEILEDSVDINRSQALENVSEDQKTIGGMTIVLKDSVDRDSVRHPSSESKLINNNYRGYDTTNSSHYLSQPTLSHAQASGRLNLSNTSLTIQNDVTKAKLRDAFAPAVIILTTFALIVAAIILMLYLKM